MLPVIPSGSQYPPVSPHLLVGLLLAPLDVLDFNGALAQDGVEEGGVLGVTEPRLRGHGTHQHPKNYPKTKQNGKKGARDPQKGE